MASLEIEKDFATVVESQGVRWKNEGVDSKSPSQARLFYQLAKKQYEKVLGDAFTISDSYKKAEADRWKTESSTWDLLERLYALRLNKSSDVDDSFMCDDSNDMDSERMVPERSASVTTTDFTRAQELMATNSLLSEYVEVRRWLEENAPEFHAVETRKGYLFYTRKSIRDRERERAVMGGKTSESVDTTSSRMVTEADPDSTSRQRRELAYEDAEYETSLVRTLYEYVRRGRAGHAIDLCVESDEPWRAASLKGGLLWRDPKLESESEMAVDGDDKHLDVRPTYPAGNINRSLWKQACAALAQDENNDLYERALYAALSGRLDEVVLVCESWEDHLWAYVNTMVESQIDQGIKDSSLLYTPAPNTSLEHVRSKYPPIRDIKQVFDSLNTHESDKLRVQASSPFRQLQAAIIEDVLPEYLDEYARKLRSQQLSEDESDILRVVVHSALYVRRIGFALPTDAVDIIIEDYISRLALNDRELVALYVSYLQADKQTETYAQFLHKLSDPIPIRVHMLKLGTAHGLDTDTISRRTTELCLTISGSDSPQSVDSSFALVEPSEPITDREHQQIRSIEWITSSPQLYKHALVEVCRLARKYLLLGRTNAATQLLNSLPDDFVQQDWLRNVYSPADSPAHQSDPEVSSYVYEYIHLLSLCDAYAQYTSWAEMLYKRPVDTGKTGARLQMQWLEWKNQITALTERSVTMFRDKLLEVDWLSTQSLCINAGNARSGSWYDEDMSKRLGELACLREIYVPETAFRLHSILFETRDAVPQNLKRSLDLAQLVADESLGIYKLMAKQSPSAPQGRLASFMDLMQQSAFEILRVEQESQENMPPLLDN
ncbi:Nucleoporin nup84 [Coemansia interrupta]|uniref:Nuclear pore complex protein n=1 Tax=Coemansia interrupta TaxID=1126814 RepID=A0A9W8HBN9_9FUNG|nr:Nucleoporin nup84 [Coemansia interrupta]